MYDNKYRKLPEFRLFAVLFFFILKGFYVKFKKSIRKIAVFGRKKV